MSIQVALHHVTHYKYDRYVALGPQVVRLRPAPHCRTGVPSYSLKITPSQHFINWQQDPHGNWLARLVFTEKATEFRVEVDLLADLAVFNPFDFFVEPYAEEFPFTYAPELAAELAASLEIEPAGAPLENFVASISRQKLRTIDFLVGLNARLSQEIRYVIRMEPGVQPPDETLTLGSGSCRDSAWLLVQMLRRLGLAARFVSGYLIQLTADVDPLEGPKGPDHDFTDLHAWAEVYLPGAGWIGLDATSGLFCGEGHLPLCAAPHYRSCAPISGVVEPAHCEFGFEMRVERIREAPRVTAPFSDEAWARLDRLGEQVDADLVAQDVRLTMGGEPTFVSIDDFEGAEWNIAAVGPTKRAIADDLIRRLRERFAPGGFLHYGQGKWYPGESLPRWAFALYWRKDGEPIWRDPELVARLDKPAKNAADEAKDEPKPGAITPKAAEAFATALVARLGVDSSYVIPAYEDPLHWIRRGSGAADQHRSSDPKIDDPEERSRIMRDFERGLSTPTGFVLPIQRWNAPASRTGWVSGRWPLRRGKLFLVPGDSPVGLRLPLKSLPWVRPEIYPHIVQQDPLDERPNCRRPPIINSPHRSTPASERQEVREQNPDEGACARRWPSSRATGRSACSCRRWKSSKIISSCSPRWSRRPRRPACRCISRAIRRRSIRASMSSR